ARAVPVAIQSKAEYRRIEAEFNRLHKELLSPEEVRLFDLLADLLESYERRTLPPLEASSPLDTLKFLMSENDLKQKDIVEFFGSQGVASEVLNGKRAISKSQAKKLGERFAVAADLFI
ncbi:MAG: hypothetical protein LH472_07395, partial [Pyrinomonadaceae bacterium]|nr:hypothetical protein [Pyrinomonadaceae bacterium]